MYGINFLYKLGRDMAKIYDLYLLRRDTGANSHMQPESIPKMALRPHIITRVF